MSNNCWPEAVAVSSVAAAVALILTPWERIGPINWEALSAVGTLGAVVVALAVPLWQNWDRRREQERAGALTEWAVIQEVHRLMGDVRAAIGDWHSDGRPPASEHVHALINDLLSVKDSITSPVGSQLLHGVLGVARSLRSAVDLAARSPSQLMQGLDGKYVAIELDDRLRGCNSLAALWTSESMRRLIKLGALHLLPR